MENLKILLVEDDPIIGRDSKKILEFIGYQVNGPFAKAEDALAANKKAENDIYIFDIELAGKMNGLELAKTLNAQARRPTIFVTGLLDESTRSEAIKSGATSFLNKPFNERNLVNAIELALLSDKNKSKALIDNHLPKSFFIKANKRYLRIELNDIDFLEASGHYMVLHQGSNQYSSSISMGTFLNDYMSADFLQTHRSYIVNMKKVTDFDDTHIYFGDKMVPVSKSKQKEFRAKLAII